MSQKPEEQNLPDVTITIANMPVTIPQSLHAHVPQEILDEYDWHNTGLAHQALASIEGMVASQQLGLTLQIDKHRSLLEQAHNQDKAEKTQHLIFQQYGYRGSIFPFSCLAPTSPHSTSTAIYVQFVPTEKVNREEVRWVYYTMQDAEFIIPPEPMYRVQFLQNHGINPTAWMAAYKTTANAGLLAYRLLARFTIRLVVIAEWQS